MDKNKFRTTCLKSLSNSSKIANYRLLDYIVASKVETLIKTYKPKSILFFLPLKIEPDLQKLIKKYRKKVEIFVPFIEEKSFKMVKYRMPLKRDSFNILSSNNSFFKQKSVDMIIVPVVGVDGNFKRVGFGKGMYDRFFDKLKTKPIVIFVQRKQCFTNKIVTHWHDISCDFYITP